MNLKRKLCMGKVGGGRGALIGAVRRTTAPLDRKIELVAGRFSADPEKSTVSGVDLFLDPARVYAACQEMAAKGIPYASQISNGDENNLNIRVYGTRASIECHQEHPNELMVEALNQPRLIYRCGNSCHSPVAQATGRTPFGRQEPFIQSFANIYLATAAAIADEVTGRKSKRPYDFPTVEDGVAGMAFIETVRKSAKSGVKWTKFPRL